MWHRRAPVVGEALEVGQRERRQVLTSKAQDTELAKRIEQQGNLLWPEPLPQVDTHQAPTGAAGRQRSLAARLRPEQPAQLAVQLLLFQRRAHRRLLRSGGPVLMNPPASETVDPIPGAVKFAQVAFGAGLSA